MLNNKNFIMFRRTYYVKSLTLTFNKYVTYYSIQIMGAFIIRLHILHSVDSIHKKNVQLQN